MTAYPDGESRSSARPWRASLPIALGHDIGDADDVEELEAGRPITLCGEIVGGMVSTSADSCRWITAHGLTPRSTGDLHRRFYSCPRLFASTKCASAALRRRRFLSPVQGRCEMRGEGSSMVELLFFPASTHPVPPVMAALQPQHVASKYGTVDCDGLGMTWPTPPGSSPRTAGRLSLDVRERVTVLPAPGHGDRLSAERRSSSFGDGVPRMQRGGAESGRATTALSLRVERLSAGSTDSLGGNR